MPDGAPAEVRARGAAGRALTGAAHRAVDEHFGADTAARIRVHDAPVDQRLARAVGARAFTTGDHIFFGPGQPTADTPRGERLLLHEAGHVAAGGGNGTLLRDEEGSEEAEPARKMQVVATGMDLAALTLAQRPENNTSTVFIGLHPKFVKVYDSKGASVGPKVAMKDKFDWNLNPGVYLETKTGVVAVLEDNNLASVGQEGMSVIATRPLTPEQRKERDAEEAAAKAENRPVKPQKLMSFTLADWVSDMDAVRGQLNKVAFDRLIYFVPSYLNIGPAGGSGEHRGFGGPLISLDGKGGEPATDPGWPVTVSGPKLVPVDSSPTFDAKIDWSAGGGYSPAAQALAQIGTTIYYRWELIDITAKAKAAMAADAAAAAKAAKDPPTDQPPPPPALKVETDRLKQSGDRTGKDVTGTDAAQREWRREFEDWWKDTQRAKAEIDAPRAGSTGQRLSERVANELAVELSGVSLAVTTIGATLRFAADAFAGPRQQQEINVGKPGTYLVRCIAKAAPFEDHEGKRVVRAATVDAKVIEVVEMDRAVTEALDESDAQLAELTAKIESAKASGMTREQAYLEDLRTKAQLAAKGSPIDVLKARLVDAEKALKEHKDRYPTLSDYSLQHTVDLLKDNIARYERHEAARTADGKNGEGVRLIATLMSQVSGETYPLLLFAGRMVTSSGSKWFVGDVTNRDGGSFTGSGDTDLAALTAAMDDFGRKAAYGRGRIGVRTEGLGLGADAPATFFVDSQPADWAIASTRIDDLVATLAAIGLLVASAGTASALIGAAVAAVRIAQKIHGGTLHFDASLINDTLAVVGGIAAGAQLVAGLRLQRLSTKYFTLLEDAKATPDGLTRAADTLTTSAAALNDATKVAGIIEAANEALNYGGLIWGNVTFLDTMIDIAEQERNGTITHAAARTQRAMAMAGALQNNAMFIAGNAMKGREPSSNPKEPSTKVPGDHPVEPTNPTEPHGTAKTAPRPSGGKGPATHADFLGALSPAIRGECTLVVDPTLAGSGNHVEVRFEPGLLGTVGKITVRVSPEATPRMVALHEVTVRSLTRYSGLEGLVRVTLSRMAEVFGGTRIDVASPEFAAQGERQKLPAIIAETADQLTKARAAAASLEKAPIDPANPTTHDVAVAKLEAQLDSLEVQLENAKRTLDFGEPGEAGYIAAKGVPKKLQQQYDQLREQLRGHEPGDPEHRRIRRQMYELIGGKLDLESWGNVYDANIEKARRANKIVAAEAGRLKLTEVETTLTTKDGDARRLDMTDSAKREGYEVKAYEGKGDELGYITNSPDIRSEIQRDASLVAKGSSDPKNPGPWKITWRLIDTEPSMPLLRDLLAAGIRVEIVRRKGLSKERITEWKPGDKVPSK
jgi:hypothetical protein